MPITMPSHLGSELSEAARWYAGEDGTEAFLAHIRDGHPWSARRPRRLLTWADRHGVRVFGARRFLTVLLAGFAGPDRWRLWRTAKIELRRACEAIARGEEAGLAYAGGRDLLAFAESGPRRWGAPESVLLPSLHASPAGPMPTPEAASSTLDLPTRPITSPPWRLFPAIAGAAYWADRSRPCPRRAAGGLRVLGALGERQS